MTSSICSSRRLLFTVSLIVLVLWASRTGSVSAQVSAANPYGLLGATGNPLSELERRLTVTATTNPMLPLEGAVDPDSYIVGPGDQFVMTVQASPSSGEPIPVAADGTLSLRDARPVKIAGLTLTEARRVFRESTVQTHGDADLDIVLLSPRNFWVHVSGAVPSPRRYLTLPVSRVSTILEDSFADTLRAPTGNSTLKPSLRNISVRHTDGTVSSVDLLNYFGSGDLHSDPYLRDGDVIFVPAYDPAFSSIYIDGAVPFPGPYDYRTDDTVRRLIAVAGGVDRNAAVENVRVIRYNPDGRPEQFSFLLEDVLSGEEGNFQLLPRDHVSVARRADLLGDASVDGHVIHAGTYPIRDGVTTLTEFLEFAGGLEPDALLRGAYLERRSIPESFQDNKRQSLLAPGTPEEAIIFADSTELLQRVRLTNMDYLSRAYFAQSTRLQNRVSIDLEKIIGGEADPIVLRDGDHLVIPRDDRTVYVFGQVVRPGFIRVQEGRPVSYYIEQAGGRGVGAANQAPYVIEPGTRNVIRSDSHVVQSGDLIFVDRLSGVADDAQLQRLVLEQERTRSDARIRTANVVLQTVATAASVAALIISLRR